MNDSFENAEIIENPLLQIDTSFRQYLNAFTRSFQNHIVDGTLDYAFDADFSVRQKISGLSGWSKLSKSIVSQDITAEAKFLFQKFNQAGPLKYSEVYDIVKICAERLELNLPIIIVRDDTDKPLIYSIAGDIIEPCLVVSTTLIKLCSKDELQLLIGCECGKIQNNHCVYNFSVTYINFNKNVFKPVEHTHKPIISNQLVYAIPEWIRYADITSDRAGMICCDDPEKFAETLVSVHNKGYVDFYGRKNDEINHEDVFQKMNKIHHTPVRSLKIDKNLNQFERRLLAAFEFYNCESLYNWRKDLSSEQIHLINQQVCDVRTNIIIGASNSDI